MVGITKLLSAVLLAGTVHMPAQSELDLSIHEGPGAHGPVIAHATLTCRPAGGTHPHPYRACHALTGASGHVDRLRGRNGICTMIYRQVTAVAYGHWGPTPVRFAKTYNNTCTLKNALAPVYDF